LRRPNHLAIRFVGVVVLVLTFLSVTALGPATATRRLPSSEAAHDRNRSYYICLKDGYPANYCDPAPDYVLLGAPVLVRVKGLGDHEGSRVKIYRRLNGQSRFTVWARPMVQNGMASVRWVPRRTRTITFKSQVRRDGMLVETNWMTVTVDDPGGLAPAA
jgi:hypothetical protein